MKCRNTRRPKSSASYEFVPGKQVTLAHLIANPEPELYKKLGVIGNSSGTLGILTITPSVESALRDVLGVLSDVLGFTLATSITRT